MKQNSFRDMKKLSVLIITVLALTCFTPLLQNVKATSNSVIFYGPFDEQTGGNFLCYNGSAAQCRVTVHYVNGGVTQFTISASSPHTFNYDPVASPLEYYDFSMIDNISQPSSISVSTGDSNTTTVTTTPNYTLITYDRQYWITSSDIVSATTFTVFFSAKESPMVFNIRALGGVSIPTFLEASTNVNGTVYNIAKIPLDINNIADIALIPNNIYQITLVSQNTSTVYNFGDVSTYTSPITLTVSALSFPSNVLYQYPYVTIYANRPDSTDILVSYQDLDNQTLSVSYTITDQYSNVVHSASYGVVYSWADDWSGAQTNVTYYISATITGSVFGVLTYSQILGAANAPSNPIDLAIFGDWGSIGISNPDQFIWVLIAFAVFLCFSALNAYVGAFAGVCVAAFFVWEGWLMIPEAVVVAAFCLVFMAIIANWKRPAQYG